MTSSVTSRSIGAKTACRSSRRGWCDGPRAVRILTNRGGWRSSVQANRVSNRGAAPPAGPKTRPDSNDATLAATMIGSHRAKAPGSGIYAGCSPGRAQKYAFTRL